MAKRGRPPVEMIKVQCGGCPTELLRYPIQVERSKTGVFFCSKDCQHRVGSKPRRKALAHCERIVCGVAFYPRSGQVNRYCTRLCKDLDARQGANRDCLHCDGTFYTAPSAPDVYCSRECYDAGRATPLGTTKPTGDGYVLTYRPDSPEAQGTGWALEHRVVMATELGHALPAGSTVHHRNGVRDDNRPVNLEVRAGSHGQGQSVPDLLDWARELIATWAPDEARLRELAVLAGEDAAA